MATWEQLNFQNSTSPIMEQFIFLHDYIMMILTSIVFLTTYLIGFLSQSKSIKKTFKDNHELEVLWTFLPGIILIFIAFPSLRLLYLTEENKEATMAIKTMGHQWYWSYEYSDFLSVEFDSFMAPSSDPSNFRLLDVDNQTTIPQKTPIQLFISSSDVLHSWTIPNLGIKADSAPGRLNTTSILAIKPGLFYGQCSEICGTNHSFMPIVLNVTTTNNFKTWINSFK